MLAVALQGLAAAAALMALGWALSVLRRDASVVDALWGPAICAAGLAYLATVPEPPAPARLAVALSLVWGLRLSAHLVRRNHGRGEDRRYREIRARNEPGFWWKSAYLVFGLQALLAWLVGMPLLGLATAGGAGGGSWRAPLLLAGVALWVSGFVFEAVADWQLLRFQRATDSPAAVMDRGLWRYSRHPNYFGEFCLWWGIGLMAAAVGAWWSLAGPALLSFFLLKVSGVALTEKDIATRRPEYRAYLERTSGFLPLPPRRSGARLAAPRPAEPGHR